MILVAWAKSTRTVKHVPHWKFAFWIVSDCKRQSDSLPHSWTSVFKKQPEENGPQKLNGPKRWKMNSQNFTRKSGSMTSGLIGMNWYMHIAEVIPFFLCDLFSWGLGSPDVENQMLPCGTKPWQGWMWCKKLRANTAKTEQIEQGTTETGRAPHLFPQRNCCVTKLAGYHILQHHLANTYRS